MTEGLDCAFDRTAGHALSDALKAALLLRAIHARHLPVCAHREGRERRRGERWQQWQQSEGEQIAGATQPPWDRGHSVSVPSPCSASCRSPILVACCPKIKLWDVYRNSYAFCRGHVFCRRLNISVGDKVQRQRRVPHILDKKHDAKVKQASSKIVQL